MTNTESFVSMLILFWILFLAHCSLPSNLNFTIFTLCSVLPWCSNMINFSLCTSGAFPFTLHAALHLLFFYSYLPPSLSLVKRLIGPKLDSAMYAERWATSPGSAQWVENKRMRRGATCVAPVATSPVTVPKGSLTPLATGELFCLHIIRGIGLQ